VAGNDAWCGRSRRADSMIRFKLGYDITADWVSLTAITADKVRALSEEDLRSPDAHWRSTRESLAPVLASGRGGRRRSHAGRRRTSATGGRRRLAIQQEPSPITPANGGCHTDGEPMSNGRYYVLPAGPHSNRPDPLRSGANTGPASGRPGRAGSADRRSWCPIVRTGCFVVR
jgi:hypothetical protein